MFLILIFFSNNQNQQVLQNSNTHSTLVMDHGTTSAGAGSHKAYLQLSANIW
jgi:hypothetical protein